MEGLPDLFPSLPVLMIQHYVLFFNTVSPYFLIFRVGRRPVLLFSVIFILIFGLTVALSVNVTMFSTLRFFEGFCLAGIVLSLYALREYSFIAIQMCFY